MARERTDMTPSLLGSVLLHSGLVLATLITWPFGREIHMEAAVPVTIVANAPVTNIRPAEQAPVQTPAMTEAPEPDATPEPAAPPAPQPPAPAPKAAQKPAPAPKAAAPAPAPRKAKPEPQKEPLLNLDALADSLKRASGKPKSSAAKGKARSETSVQARRAEGQASDLAASALASLSADLARRWNPNCEVEGGADVNIDVAFRLNDAGQIVGDVEASGERSSNSVVRVAADRAKRAVHAAAPFDNLPSELYGERIVVRFNARSACASG